MASNADNASSDASFAAVQGKNRSIFFFMRSKDKVLMSASGAAVSSASKAETIPTKYTIDAVKLPRSQFVSPMIPRISAVAWQTTDGKEEIRVYYATPNSVDPDMPQLMEIGQSNGGPWFATKSLYSKQFNLHKDSQICAVREGTNIYQGVIKVYFWRPSGKSAVCWGPIPVNQAANISGVVWKDEDLLQPSTPASLKL